MNWVRYVAFFPLVMFVMIMAVCAIPVVIGALPILLVLGVMRFADRRRS